MISKKEEPSFTTISKFALGLFINWLGKQITKLTKFFPFSLIPDRWCLHYKNRDVVYAWDCLTNAWLKAGVYFKVNQFEKNDYFIIFEGIFCDNPPLMKIKKCMKFLENKFIKGNVFLQKDKDRYLIFFNKEAVTGQLLN